MLVSTREVKETHGYFCITSCCYFEASIASITVFELIILRAASLHLYCKQRRWYKGLRGDMPKPMKEITVLRERCGMSSTVESNMYTKCLIWNLATGAAERMWKSVREKIDKEVGEDGRQAHPHRCHLWWDCQSSAVPAQSFLPNAQLPLQACCLPQLCWSWTAGSAELLQSV